MLAEALRRAAADRAQAAREVKAEEQADEVRAALKQAEEAAEEAGARSPVGGGASSASSRNCDVATQALRLNTL